MMIGSTRVAWRTLLIAAGAVVLSVVILVSAHSWYAVRRAELDSAADAIHAEWSRVQDLTAGAAEWQAQLEESKMDLGRYCLVVDDVSTAPTDTGFRLIDRAEFGPLMLTSLQKLAEDTKCVLATYAPEPTAPAPAAGQAVGQGADTAAPHPSGQWEAADPEAATIRITGRYESVERFICGLSDFDIPTTGIEQFWKFPQLVAITNITMRSLTPEPGSRGPAGPQPDPLIEATLSARVFVPKPIDLGPTALSGEPLIGEPGSGEPSMEFPYGAGGPGPEGQPPGGPGGPGMLPGGPSGPGGMPNMGGTGPGRPGMGPGAMGPGGMGPGGMGPGGAGPRMGGGGMGPGAGAPGVGPGAGPGAGGPRMGPGAGGAPGVGPGGGGMGRRFQRPDGGQPGGTPGMGPGANPSGGARRQRPGAERGANQPEGGGGEGRQARPPLRSQG